MAERVLVTGATGFIGSHLIQELVKAGANVTCLVRPTSDISQYEGLGLSFKLGDVLERNSLTGPTSNADVVFHLVAAQESFDPQGYYDLNVGGTRNLVEACAENETPPVFIHVSSISAAGPSPDGELRNEKDPPSPISHYGRSKLASEEVLRAWAHKVPITIIRAPIVFGERDKDVYQMFQWIKYGLHLIIPPRGSCFSLIHAADLSKGLLRAAREGERIDGATALDPSGKGLYYFSYDHHPSYGELGKIVATSLGKSSVRLIRVPPPITWVIATIYEIAARIRRKPNILSFDKARDAFAGSLTCSADKAEKQLGFKPEKTLEQRMRQTAQWYLDNGWL